MNHQTSQVIPHNLTQISYFPIQVNRRILNTLQMEVILLNMKLNTEETGQAPTP